MNNTFCKFFEQFGEAVPQLALAVTYFVHNPKYIYHQEGKVFGVPSTLVSIILSAGSIIIGIVTGLLAGKSVWNARLRSDGESPLHWAARTNDTEGVRACIAQGMDVNLQDGNGCTPLHWAAIRGYLEVTIILLEAGAQVNVQNKDDRTPLMRAAHWGDLKVVEELLAAGAQASALKSKCGRTAADWAANNSIKEAIENAIKAQNA